MFEEFCGGENASEDRCNLDGLWEHFKDHGSDLLFGCVGISSKLRDDLLCYAKRYPDILEGFCENDISKCQIDLLYHHWNKIGVLQSEVIFGCFDLPSGTEEDARCYAERYISLLEGMCQNDRVKCDIEKLYYHW